MGNWLYSRDMCSERKINMLRIGQLKLHPGHNEKDLLCKIAKTLRISEQQILSYEIKKQSIDARKKSDIKFVYTIDVSVSNEQQVLKLQKGNGISLTNEKRYEFLETGTQELKHRPVIIGTGPAGLFCAYMLAQHGYQPVVFERGSSVENRTKDIEEFWNTGVLNPESNVQFGEGGAGTFSDGKLNTLVKDTFGRNKKVLQIFVENGAPSEILYQNKPHIGTDILCNVVRNMRQRILAWGGEIHFNSKFTNFNVSNGKLQNITIVSNDTEQLIPAEVLVLAIGHSARDTFAMLYEKQLPMEAKSFAVGVRVEHTQQMMNQSQYGENPPVQLPAASYKVATNLANGRGVYSFCMCPGGFVVNASSEEGHLAVNGMSYHARDGRNANSAIIVTVTPDDFESEHPLAGIQFQKELESKAYQLGKGKIPVQCFVDFCNNQATKELGNVEPQIKGSYILTNLRPIFPEAVSSSIEEGIKSFDKQIQGFANPDTVLSAVESRTSSPVRILRNDMLQVENTGIYPCGEGAGYAGGITSAAMDGIKVAEMIAKVYSHFDKQSNT